VGFKPADHNGIPIRYPNVNGRFSRSNSKGRGGVSGSKRQRILVGMLETVGAEGYEATSVRAVLGRCGLYRQAFYDLFADKADCYVQAHDAEVERLEALMREAAGGGAGWEDRVRAGLAVLLEFLEAEPDVGRALIVEIHRAGPAARERRVASMRRASEYLDRARLEKGSQTAPPITAEAVAAGIHAILHSRLANREDRFRQLLPELMYVAVLPFFGAEEAARELPGAAS
jgi:AcrR family transcriptional regulator